MNTVEMTGKTPEEAIEFALKELDAERGEVEIDVVNRGKSGILGIGGEPARGRVTLIEQPSDLARVATEVLEDLIERMDVLASVHLKQAYNEEVDGPIIEVDGEDSGLLIGRRGETLRSLQFIVSFICAKRMGERVNLFVDVAGYQERRYNSLRNLAKRVGQRVADGGLPITLEPMPPNERRIVHLTLANDSNVSTGSVGHGDQRQVVVEPRE
ncbi:MAG: protein jag [Chloroflexi bacterium]|nr:protein jag [Chloroflexota bacterium]